MPYVFLVMPIADDDDTTRTRQRTDHENVECDQMCRQILALSGRRRIVLVFLARTELVPLLLEEALDTEGVICEWLGW